MTTPFKTYGLYLFILALPSFSITSCLGRCLGWLHARNMDTFLAWMPYWGLVLLGFLGLQLNQTRILAAALWIMSRLLLFSAAEFLSRGRTRRCVVWKFWEP